MTYKISIAGFLISALAFVLKKGCGFECEYIVFRWLPLLGMFYFLVVGFLSAYRRPEAVWILSVGVGLHTGLIHAYILNDGLCPWCLAVYAVNVAALTTVVKKKHLAFVVVVSLYIFTLITYKWIPPGQAITPAQSAASDLAVHNQTEKITVFNLYGDPVELDVSKKQILLWSPYCDACLDVLPVAGQDVELVAVWVDDDEDIKLALDEAESFGRETYVMSDPKFEFQRIPIMLRWNPELASIEYDVPGE